MRTIVCLLLLLTSAGSAGAADRPNVVFIVSEDNSSHYLKLYNEHGAATPNIDKLAEKGLVFNHAFSCAPVCSVARTTLATGVYAPRISTNFHRKLKQVTLPEGWRLFHEYLRDAGYYVTNNSKTDYNVAVNPGKSWDASNNRASWKNRPTKDTPFFHMESHGVSHESSLHFNENVFKNQTTKTDPKSVTVWPYFPDTPLFRYTTARYHDRMMNVDEIVGRVVAELEKEGMLEDTFIFYFGDHGGVLPGSKGYAWERGLHVPLVVRIPANFKTLVPFKQGTRVDGFVEFVDFGPTVLHLAGVKVPQHMDGKPFLGKGITAEQVSAKDEAFGYADRFDEKYDMVRTLRKGRYKYVRSYQGFYPDGLMNNYRYKMLAYQEWLELFKAGKLNAAQNQFFQPRPAEALYDIETDPHELKNLAGDEKFAGVLENLRGRLTARGNAMPDLGFFPEPVLVEDAVDQPLTFAKRQHELINQLVDVANLQLVPFDEASTTIQMAIASKNPWVRYWSMIVCSSFGEQARSLADDARELLMDSEPLVRVRAAEFLGIIRAADPVPTIMDVLKTSDSHVTALLTLNTVVFLRDWHGYKFTITKKDVKATGGEVARRLEYLN